MTRVGKNVRIRLQVQIAGCRALRILNYSIVIITFYLPKVRVLYGSVKIYRTRYFKLLYT